MNIDQDQAMIKVAIRKAKSAIERLRRMALRAVVGRPLLSPVHRALVSSEHGRELSAVVAGQRRYQSDLREAATTYFLLRRDVHRLEKGLIMRPRRASFAAGYIGSVVAIFRKALETADYKYEGNPELHWASDVLATYFGAVSAENVAVRTARDEFTKLPRPPVEAVSASPFHRERLDRPLVPFEDFERLCQYRRSVRWFLSEPVSREVIDRALLVAAQAPSACNRQPFVFRVCDDPAVAKRVVSIPMGTAGFSHQVPGVVVVVGRLRAYPNERDRHAIYIDGSLASMSLILAFETLGVATCAINWPDQEPHESRMRAELSLEDDERVIMLIAFGYPDPDGMVPFSAKRPLTQLRSYHS